MHDRLKEPCMITQDYFIRFMDENVPKSCTHMHDLTQVSCMNLAKIHNMIMQEIFAWARPIPKRRPLYATATTQILNLSNLLKGKGSDIKRTSRKTVLLKGSYIKRTSRRTVLLKGSDIKRTSRRPHC